jgi:hypothetical protein
LGAAIITVYPRAAFCGKAADGIGQALSSESLYSPLRSGKSFSTLYRPL